ncbi:MAG: phage head-tail connector protein [Alphaproteobacteria bacterium]|nr:phage head-tail connector protein [Alphaproteobacteria bacterium]
MINLIIKNNEKQVITLDILKSHLRIAHNYEDEYLNNIIDTATGVLESNLELSILYKTYKYVISNYNINYPITLPMRNVNSIRSVVDSTNNSLSFNNNNCEIKLDGTIGKLPISIEYIAGFTNNTEEIPKDLKLSVLQISKNIYDNSEDYVLDSKYIQNIIQKYKQLHL